MKKGLRRVPERRKKENLAAHVTTLGMNDEVDALSDVAKDFYDFCLSEEGQEIVVASGNVAVK